jgi:hypothetical protein
MVDRTKIIERIKKVLALAKGAGTTEGEAASAAERAQAMLAEYNLSMADVVEASSDEMIIDDNVYTDSYPWRRPLATMVARMAFCEYFYTTIKHEGSQTAYDRHHFVGLRHNVKASQVMFDYLITTVDRLAREGARSLPPPQRSPYRVAFRSACSGRLCDRIKARLDAIKKGDRRDLELRLATSNLPALQSLYETSQRMAQETIAKSDFGTGMVTMKQKLRTDLHDQGARDGAEAGENIGLDQQLGQAHTARLSK